MRVSTFNIRNTTDRYDERKDLLSETISQQSGALISCFQEVSWSQIPLIYSALGHKGLILQSSCYAPITSRSKPDYHVDGDLMVINTAHPDVERIVLISHRVVILSFERQVQIAVIDLTRNYHRIRMVVANTHLHDGTSREDRLERYKQVEVAVEEIEKEKGDVYIFMGDFNSNHTDATYGYLRTNGWRSGAFETNGKEFEKTFPSGIQAPTMDNDEPDAGCVDYIWFKGNVMLYGSYIFGDKPLKTDSTIYPSDHYGVSVCMSL